SPNSPWAAPNRGMGRGRISEMSRGVAVSPTKAKAGTDRGGGGDKVAGKITERLAWGFPPVAMPAKPAGFAIGERLAGDHPGAMRQRQRSSVKADCFVKPAPNVIRALLPP